MMCHRLESSPRDPVPPVSTPSLESFRHTSLWYLLLCLRPRGGSGDGMDFEKMDGRHLTFSSILFGISDETSAFQYTPRSVPVRELYKYQVPGTWAMVYDRRPYIIHCVAARYSCSLLLLRVRNG